MVFRRKFYCRTSWSCNFVLLTCAIIIFEKVDPTLSGRPLITPTDDKSLPNIQLTSYRLYGNGDDSYRNYASGIKKVKLSTPLPEDIEAKENNTWVIYHNIDSVIFSCTAHFPIQWTQDNLRQVDDTDAAFLSRRAWIFRTAENLSDPDSYTYRVDLEFDRHESGNTGQYKCESTEQSNIVSQINLFFEGLTGRIFPESDLHHVLTIGVNNKENLVIPCYTSLPDIPVILYRRGLYGSPDIDLEIDFLPLEFNDTGIISFDSLIGFTINVLNFTRAIKDTIEGTYKCTTNFTDDTDDNLILHVLNEYTNNSLEFLEEYFKENASFYVEGSGTNRNTQITCCSSSAVAPSLVALYCKDPVTCKMIHPLKPDADFKDPESRGGLINGSCNSEHLFPYDAFIYGCYGDGVKAVRRIYNSPISDSDGTFKVYTDWSEIEPELMIELTIHVRLYSGQYFPVNSVYKGADKNNDDDSGYYVGESVAFSCQPTPIYFAGGTRWQLRYKNKTVVPLNKLESRFRSRLSLDWNSVKMLNDSMGKYVFCRWYRLAAYIFARHGTASLLADWDCGEFQREAQYWPLGTDEQVTISCVIEGDPLPNFTVYKDDRLLKLKNEPDCGMWVNYFSNTRNKTEVAVMRKTVTHDSQGVYTFVAHNFAGERRANIVVFVYERENWAFISLLVIGIATCLIIIGVLTYRTIAHRKERSNMNLGYVNYRTENKGDEVGIQPEL